jgi:hypothetical protein
MIRPDVSGVNADVPVVNTDFQSYLFKRQYAYGYATLTIIHIEEPSRRKNILKQLSENPKCDVARHASIVN